jgi:hypothetical protein
LVTLKIKVLDFLIENFKNSFDPQPYLTPDILNVKSDYFVTFPHLVDDYFELFTEISCKPDKKIKSLRKEKFLQCCKDKRIEDVKLLFDTNYLHEGFKIVCEIGNKELVDFFISKGVDGWNWGICYAARGGHQELVNLFISKGADDWNNAMYYTAKGGYKDLVDFFIEKGAKNWNYAIYGAAEGGHKDLVDFFISKGATNWNYAMSGAARGGHKNLVDFFIEKGAYDWHRAITSAAEGEHKDLVDFFKQKLQS